MNTLTKYKLEDLHLGMYVHANELSNIYDMHIVLINARVFNGDIEGEIGFIGKKLNSQSSSLNVEGASIAHIYNDSTELEDDITYDE